MRRLLVVVLTLLLVGLIAVPATASTPKGLEDRFAQGTWSCGDIVAPGHRVAWVDGAQYLATDLVYDWVKGSYSETWSYDFGNGPWGDQVECTYTGPDSGGMLTVVASAVKVPRH